MVVPERVGLSPNSVNCLVPVNGNLYGKKTLAGVIKGLAMRGRTRQEGSSPWSLEDLDLGPPLVTGHRLLPRTLPHFRPSGAPRAPPSTYHSPRPRWILAPAAVSVPCVPLALGSFTFVILLPSKGHLGGRGALHV